MSAVRVGAKVRTPQGRITWTVRRMVTLDGAGDIAVLQSEHGTTQRYPASRLVVLSDDGGSRGGNASVDAGPATRTDDGYWEGRDGAICVDGEVVRGSNNLVALVVEPERPMSPGCDRGGEAVVTAAIYDHDVRDFLHLRASSPTRHAAELTQAKVVELAAELTRLAALMGRTT